MKKLLSVLSALVITVSFAACSEGASKGAAEETTAQAEETTAPSAWVKDNKSVIDQTIEDMNFEGIVYITQNGEVAYSYAKGQAENGTELTAETSLPIGSTSKQFCAASIIMLRDQGKLSVDDKLSKYFPEYEIGKDITIKNLLTMRSGILDMVNQGSMTDLTEGKTEEENVKLIKDWIFSQQLQFDPDTAYAYSNSNFFLLANIVEQVSGESYINYVRKNIFEPLGMNNSGFIDELADNPSWGSAVSADELQETKFKGIAKGAGDVVSNGPDMDKWMTGLSGGEIVSEASYKEMTTDYSPEYADDYGYGLQRLYAGAYGHPGAIDEFSAVDYINTENNINLFAVTNKASLRDKITVLPENMLYDTLGV